MYFKQSCQLKVAKNIDSWKNTENSHWCRASLVYIHCALWTARHCQPKNIHSDITSNTNSVLHLSVTNYGRARNGCKATKNAICVNLDGPWETSGGSTRRNAKFCAWGRRVPHIWMKSNWQLSSPAGKDLESSWMLGWIWVNSGLISTNHLLG